MHKDNENNQPYNETAVSGYTLAKTATLKQPTVTHPLQNTNNSWQTF